MRGSNTLWQRWRERGDGPGLSIALGLVVLLVGLIVFLVFGENPWASGIHEKIKAGVELTVEEGIITGVWYAAAVNAGICLVLLASSWMWVGTTRLAQETKQREAEKAWRGGGDTIGVLGGTANQGTGVWFWCLLILTVVVAAWIRYPRLDDGFGKDEEQAFRKYTWGTYVVQDDVAGGAAVDRVNWKRSLFYTMAGENHVMHTVGARIADSIWRRVGDYDDDEFSEAVVRSGPYLAALATIALLGLWLRSAGYPLVGVVAAALLALNPWHIRYSVEARGFSEMLLWILLANIVLGAALGKGRWRWWISYGLFQAWYLLCFPGAIYFSVAQNVIVIVVLLARQDGGSLWRWLVATAIGAMMVVQCLLPSLPMIQSWMTEQQGAPLLMDHGQFVELWSRLMAGVPWTTSGAGLHHGVSVADLGAAGPWIFGLALPLLALLGLGTAITRGGRVAMYLLTAVSAFGLISLYQQLSEKTFSTWYHFYQLLVVVVGLAFVVELVRRREPLEAGRGESSRQGKGAWLVALLIIGFYGFVTWAPRHRIRSFEQHPMKQAVEHIRGKMAATGGGQGGVITATIGTNKGLWRTYDPYIHELSSSVALTRLLEMADEAGKPLWVYRIGAVARQEMPADAFDLLNDEGLFTKGEFFRGMEEMSGVQVYRHQPRTAKAGPPIPPPPAIKKPAAKPRPASRVEPSLERGAASVVDDDEREEPPSGTVPNGL